MSIRKPDSKLDPQLQREIATRLKGAEASASDPTFQVTIELASSPQYRRAESRELTVANMEDAVREAQAGAVGHLQELGVAGFERYILSGALGATLTASQIWDIAGREDVKLIRLVRLTHVTTAERESGKQEA